MNGKRLGVALAAPLLLAPMLITGCASTTSHFGVRDRASHVPDWITDAEVAIARSAAAPRAQACPDQLARARKYAERAMEVYWSCRDADAQLMLAEARRLAGEAEYCGASANRMLELSAEALFGFNRSDLTRQGEATLSEFLDDLRKASYSGVLIVGHTDPIGSDAHNQRLSEQRAQAVARYLAKNGAPAERLRAEGRGERELKVAYQQCAAQGAKRSAALIQCYQPNRRVTVSVTGAE